MKVHYGGSLLDHWSAAWLRPLGTVVGLWVAAGVTGIGLVALGPVAWSDLLPSLSLVGVAAIIALHLHRQESDQPPDAGKRWLFNLAWGLILLAMISL